MLFLKSPPTPSHTFASRGRQGFPKAFFSSPLRGSLIPQPLDNRRVPEKGCSWGSWGLQEPASPMPSGNLASGVPSLREMSQSRAGRQAPPRCAPGGGALGTQGGPSCWEGAEFWLCFSSLCFSSQEKSHTDRMARASLPQTAVLFQRLD